MRIKCGTCDQEAKWIFWVSPGVKTVPVDFRCKECALEHPAIDYPSDKDNWIELPE